MKEIKFRAWFDGPKLMGQVVTLKGSNRNDYKGNMWDSVLAECFQNGRQQFYESYNFTLLQYTGLKDKNGKEIYEGDVVKCHDHPTGVDSATGEVYFSQGAYRVKDTICLISDFGTAWTEVIGNIYENPKQP